MSVNFKLMAVRNPVCTKCELFLEAHTVCLMGAGESKQPDLMLVGDCPGPSEDHSGVPFIGDVGQRLNNILLELGIDKQKIYMTNAVKCHTPDHRKPKKVEIDACRDYLLQEIRLVQPKVIVAMGQAAAESLLAEKNMAIGKNRGAIRYMPDEGLSHIPVVVTYHPSYTLRVEYAIKYMLEDLEKAVSCIDGVRQDTITVKRGVAPAAKRVVIDLETSDLDTFSNNFETFCLGTCSEPGVGHVTDHKSKVKEICEDPKVMKVGHNLKYDIKALAREGITVKGPIFDTLVAAHMLDENLPSFGLKELAVTFTPYGDYAREIREKMKAARNSMRSVWTEDPNMVRKYCGHDVGATYDLMRQFTPRLKQEGLWPLFKLMMRAEKMIARAELRGIKVDTEMRYKLGVETENGIIKANARINKRVGEDFNPNSPAQLVEHLIGTLGMPILKKTRKGKPSVDKYVLQRYLSHDRTGIVKAILRLRELNGDWTKWLSPKKKLLRDDGFLHCDYRLNGTDTGRYSCADPPMQQVTKVAVEGRPPIKALFISRWPTGSIGRYDVNQGELRLLAQYSGDKRLIRIFQEGLDIHRHTAVELFGVKAKDVTDKQRHAAKTINFGIIYGMGAGRLAKEIGCGFTEAVSYITKYKKRLPGVGQYIRDMEDILLRDGEVVSLFKRKRRLVVLNKNSDDGKRAMRQAVNAPIQGGLHDLNLLCAVAIEKEMLSQGLKSCIILDVHDEIVFDIYPGEELKVEAICRAQYEHIDTTEFGFQFTVPITIGFGIGRNWKEATENG